MEFTESDLENEASTSHQRYGMDGDNEASTSAQLYDQKLQYDPAGPFKQTRFRTDFCWLLGFCVFLVVWLIVIIYAFSAGDVSKWQGSTDSQGRVCGYDLEVYDRPYLLRYNRDTCSDHECLVCVAQCPRVDFNYYEHNAIIPRIIPSEATIELMTTTMTTATTTTARIDSTTSLQAAESSTTASTMAVIETTTAPNRTRRSTSLRKNLSFDEMRKYMICKPDVKLDYVIKWAQLDYLVKERMCAMEYPESKSPRGQLCGAFNDTGRNGWRHTLPKISRDISDTKYSVMGFILLSACMSLLSIALMRWYAPAFVCGSIFVLCVLVFFFIYGLCIGNAESKTNGVLLALFICVVVLVLVVLVCIYFRQKIFLACQMIRESSKSVTCLPSTLGVSFGCFVVYLLALTLGVSVYFALTTIELPDYRAHFAKNQSESNNDVEASVEVCHCPSELDYQDHSVCDPTTFEAECKTSEGRKCVISGCYLRGIKTKSVGFLKFLNFLGLFWSYGFVAGLGDMILASVFATWYWSYNKKSLTYTTIVEGFWRVSTYHLGTIVLGALIIGVCTTIRCVIKTTYKILNKINVPVTALILLHFKCCFDILDNFLDFVSRRAYIVCAIHGTDFIQSARTAYYLIKRNVTRVVLVYQVTHCLLFALAILISGISTAIAVSYYASRSEDISFTSVPATLVFVGSYLVARMLLGALEVAIDTIFHCYLEDTERNDGSSERPYCMSDEFTMFLEKK